MSTQTTHLVERFRENRDREYLNYNEALKQKECLGWKAKIKAGEFGETELNAHCKANEYFGRYLAWNMATEELLRYGCHECGGTGGVDSGGVTPWGSPIMLPCPSCLLNAEANKGRQIEKELRYCLAVIEDNLDVKHDLRIEYAKTLVFA